MPHGLGAVSHWAAPAGYLHRCDVRGSILIVAGLLSSTQLVLHMHRCSHEHAWEFQALIVAYLNMGNSSKLHRVWACSMLLRENLGRCTDLSGPNLPRMLFCIQFFLFVSHSEVLTRKCVLGEVSSLSSLV